MKTNTNTPAEDDQLDLIFKALGDRTRRNLLATLSSGHKTISQLAEPLNMSLPAVSKHIRVLENAALVHRTKEGRVQTCTLHSEPMAKADAWLSYYSKFWNARLDALADFLSNDLESSNLPDPDNK